jgi:hypothetical protein
MYSVCVCCIDYSIENQLKGSYECVCVCVCVRSKFRCAVWLCAMSLKTQRQNLIEKSTVCSKLIEKSTVCVCECVCVCLCDMMYSVCVYMMYSVCVCV